MLSFWFRLSSPGGSSPCAPSPELFVLSLVSRLTWGSCSFARGCPGHRCPRMQLNRVGAAPRGVALGTKGSVALPVPQGQAAWGGSCGLGSHWERPTANKSQKGQRSPALRCLRWLAHHEGVGGEGWAGSGDGAEPSSRAPALSKPTASSCSLPQPQPRQFSGSTSRELARQVGRGGQLSPAVPQHPASIRAQGQAAPPAPSFPGTSSTGCLWAGSEPCPRACH